MRKHPWVLAALVLLLVLLGANFRLLSGSAAPKWDADDFFCPYFTLVADHARAGTVLLWDPWTSGGTPVFAEPELGSLSPLVVLISAITGGTEPGFRIYWLLIWLLGGLGILLLARHLGAPPWGGFIVALGFASSGFYTGHAEHTSSLYAISFLPLFLWRLDVALAAHRLRPAVEAGALWGLSALGGYPQLTILSAGFLFLWALGRWSCAESEEEGQRTPSKMRFQESALRPSLSFMLVVLVLFLLVGVLVLSPSYVGFLTEAHGYSDRVGVRSREEAVESQALQAGALATFASPYLSMLKLYGNSKLWEFTDVSMSSIYLGASIAVLGLLALTARPRSSWRWWLAGVGLFFLACALGKHLPVRGWLYDLFPPTRYFRNPALFRVYAMFSVALLALLATKDLQAATKDAFARIWKQFVYTATVVAAAALAVYGSLMGSVDQVGDAFHRANFHLGLVWLGTVAVSSVLVATSRKNLLPLLLGSLAITDAILSFGLARPTIYDTGVARKWWDRINTSHSALLDLGPKGLSRDVRPAAWLGPQVNNRNIPLRVPTFENYAPLSNRFQMDFAKRPILVAMSTGEQRIWFSRQVAMVAPTDASYATFVKRTEALGVPVLVVHSRKEMSRVHKKGEATARDAQEVEVISRLSAAQRVSAKVLRYWPNELRFEVSCPDNGWLLVTDRWSPGWQATVNGSPTEVFAGNFIFRAVPVQAGKNELRFSYHPRGWPILLILSWGTLLVVFARPDLILGRITPA